MISFEARSLRPDLRVGSHLVEKDALDIEHVFLILEIRHACRSFRVPVFQCTNPTVGGGSEETMGPKFSS